MSVTRDIAPVVDEVYPLYLQVYERSPLHFEKLTKAHLCELGRVMPDKVRFFVWRQSGKPVAFSVSMVHGDTIYNEYLGLDYAVALNLHLYFRAFRDIMLPLAAPGLMASAIFVFLESLDEFTGTYFVGAPDVTTLPLLLYTAGAGGNYQIASITALILLVPSIAFMFVVERFLRADVLARVGR